MPGVVEFAADEAEQRGLDLGIGQFGTAGHETHDRGRDLLGDQPLAGLHDGSQRLFPGHRREPQAVLRDRGHRRLEALERRQIILAQRDQHPVVAARKIEALGRGFVRLELRLQRSRRPILDQIGEIFDEARRACAAEIVRLRQREDLLELVEDQQRHERRARGVAQHVVAMMQKLPQRFALLRDAGLSPLARVARGLQNGALDLLRGLRRLAAVVDAHINRAIALSAQTRHQTGAQNRGFAETRLAEQDGQQLALHAARQLRNFLLPSVEILPGLFGERGEAQPWIGGIDGRCGRCRVAGVRWGQVHCCRACMKSLRRLENSSGTTPPGR